MTGGRTPDTSIEEVRVLHVDDDPDFLELARTFLKREDDRTTTAPAMDRRNSSMVTSTV
ncbi:MAG: hypothetical protein ABEI76_03130 [Halobacteriales archaeon]